MELVNSTDKQKLVGSNEADYIINTGEHVTIQPGRGADTLEGSEFGEMYLIGSSDGDNTITNFSVGDTLKIAAGSLQSSVVNGDDVVFSIKGTNYTGMVTLGGAGDCIYSSGG